MALYINMNQAMQNIYRRFVTDEDLHVYSIDESILDVTASHNLFGPAEAIAAAVFCKRKMHVFATEDLTAPDLHFCC